MDTSDRIGVARIARKAALAEKEIVETEAVSPVDSPAEDPPACSLKFRGTLFGGTLSKVFNALDGLALGQEVAITTNDP